MGSIFPFLLRKVFLWNRYINIPIYFPSQNPYPAYLTHMYGPGFENMDISCAGLCDRFCLPKRSLAGLLRSHCYSQGWAEKLGTLVSKVIH